MLPFSDPTILMTRPLAASLQFVDELRHVAGPFKPVLSPAFHLEGISVEFQDFSAAVFTSQAGVSFAPAGLGRTAWCVGQATAKAARSSGYQSITSSGDVGDLVKLILQERPSDSLLHIRGEAVRGNVTADLLRAGLKCREVISYRKSHHSLGETERAQIAETQNLLIPAFSAETVSLIKKWPVPFERAHLIAMSATVANAATGLSCANVHVSDSPDIERMIKLTASLIA